MPSDILKQIELEIKGETPVVEAPAREESSVVESKPESNVTREVTKDTSDDDGEDNPTKSEVKTEPREQKLSRRQQAAKEANERIAKLEAIVAERDKELQRQRSEDAKKLEPFLNEKNRVEQQKQEDKRKAELLERAKTNPDAVISELLEEKVKQYFEPIRQQQEYTQKKAFVDTSLSKMREWAGSDEVYNGVTALIPDVMAKVKQNSGPEAARLLALNPEVLYGYLESIYNKNNKTKQVSQNQENLKKKQDLADINASVSKPNQIKRETTSNKNTTRNEIDNFLLNLSGQKR